MQEINHRCKTWGDKLGSISKIRDALIDNESQIIFDARLEFMIDRDEDKYFDKIESLPRKWNCPEIKQYITDSSTKIVVFGCGHDGIRTKRILCKCGFAVECFCDSKRFGQKVDGIDVLSVEELTERKMRRVLIIIGSSKYGDEIIRELERKRYPSKRIVKPKDGVLWAEIGKQYFDFFPCDESEIFIDAGAYNGDTVLEFIKWTSGNYNKIFVMEPLQEMCNVMEKEFKEKGFDNIVLCNCAAWDKDEELCFKKDETGSTVKSMEESDSIVRGVAIDKMVDGQNITFIKMDIEGSELRALEGARNTIVRCKPKLAICIYHKPWDVIDLALYILELVPEYKLGIRHYSSNMWETVLYATV